MSEAQAGTIETRIPGRLDRLPAYYRRKLDQAKAPEEARRSLKRHLSNVVHAHLVADHRRRTLAS